MLWLLAPWGHKCKLYVAKRTVITKFDCSGVHCGILGCGCAWLFFCKVVSSWYAFKPFVIPVSLDVLWWMYSLPMECSGRQANSCCDMQRQPCIRKCRSSYLGAKQQSVKLFPILSTTAYQRNIRFTLYKCTILGPVVKIRNSNECRPSICRFYFFVSNPSPPVFVYARTHAHVFPILHNQAELRSEYIELIPRK